jgi:hypothetical protein
VASANVSTVEIPVITDTTWAAKIEQSVRPHEGYGPRGRQENSSPYLVSLVRTCITILTNLCSKPVLQACAPSYPCAQYSKLTNECAQEYGYEIGYHPGRINISKSHMSLRALCCTYVPNNIVLHTYTCAHFPVYMALQTLCSIYCSTRTVLYIRP